jgi:hypothetical protein
MHQRTDLQKNLARAIAVGTDRPIYFGKLDKKKYKQINELRVQSGLLPVLNLSLYVYPNVIHKLHAKRIGMDKLTGEQIVDIAYSALHNSTSRIFPSKNPLAQMVWQVRERTSYLVFVGGYENAFSVKSIFPVFTEKVIKKFVRIKKTPRMGGAFHHRSRD